MSDKILSSILGKYNPELHGRSVDPSHPSSSMLGDGHEHWDGNRGAATLKRRGGKGKEEKSKNNKIDFRIIFPKYGQQFEWSPHLRVARSLQKRQTIWILSPMGN